jgi:hypothetical protein
MLLAVGASSSKQEQCNSSPHRAIIGRHEYHPHLYDRVEIFCEPRSVSVVRQYNNVSFGFRMCLLAYSKGSPTSAGKFVRDRGFSLMTDAWRWTFFMVLGSCVAACASRSAGGPGGSSSRPTPYATTIAVSGARVVREIRSGFSARCLVDGQTSPSSYLARDLGKPGVPHVNPKNVRMLNVIGKYVHTTTLRFAYIGSEFIVFDAAQGPCAPYAPGYSVLNGTYNEMYSPTDDFTSTTAVPGDAIKPRPWTTRELGGGTRP